MFRSPFSSNAALARAVEELQNDRFSLVRFTRHLEAVPDERLSADLERSLAHGMTLYHVAAALGRADAVEYLLSRGVDTQKLDFTRETGYQKAVKNNDLTTLKKVNDFTVARETREVGEARDRAVADAAEARRETVTLKRSRERLAEEKAASDQTARVLTAENSGLRRSKRLMTQRNRELIEENRKLAEERDTQKRRADTMRDKIFKR